MKKTFKQHGLFFSGLEIWSVRIRFQPLDFPRAIFVEWKRGHFNLDVQASEVSMLHLNRDKGQPRHLWLRDESLEESDNLPDPDVLARRSSKISKPFSNNFPKSRW